MQRPGGTNGVPASDDDERGSVPVRSWSQYSSYLHCPKSWWLSKIRKVPRRPGVWLSAGTAVHAVIARHLIEETVDIHWRSYDYES